MDFERDMGTEIRSSFMYHIPIDASDPNAPRFMGYPCIEAAIRAWVAAAWAARLLACEDELVSWLSPRLLFFLSVYTRFCWCSGRIVYENDNGESVTTWHHPNIVVEKWICLFCPFFEKIKRNIVLYTPLLASTPKVAEQNNNPRTGQYVGVYCTFAITLQ